MGSHNNLQRFYVIPFFPDSAYLSDKWWHRLATVISWIWLIVAAAGVIVAAWDIRDGDPVAAGELGLWLLSVPVPIVVYRLILFVCIGSAWKGESAQSNLREAKGAERD